MVYNDVAKECVRQWIGQDEDHFMLHCTAYKEQRSQSIHLQQPYLESDQNTVGQFLFDKENIEEKKELLFTI